MPNVKALLTVLALLLVGNCLHAQDTPVPPPQGKVYYLFVGIGKYTDRAFARLSSPVKDARAMAKLLPAAYPGEVTILLNEEATKANIQTAFERIRGMMQPEDSFVFYFSGHGRSTVSADGTRRWNFLQPVDSIHGDYSLDIGTRSLNAWLATFPTPERVAVILDSCYSGGLVRPGENVRYTMLTASADNEYSLDTESGSLFTKKLLEGLTWHKRQADRDSDNTISARELFDFAAPRTASAADKLRRKQHPQLFPGNNPTLFKY